MRAYTIVSIALWAMLSPQTTAISITATDNPGVLAAAIFNGPGVDVNNAGYAGATTAAGTFTTGPFGIGSGAILTSGAATGALPGGNGYVNNGVAGSTAYCGANSFNAAILTVDINVQVGFTGLLIDFILASFEEGQQPDPIAIFLDGTQYAKDTNGVAITATSSYLRTPIYIATPDNDMSYPGASPPLELFIPASPGPHTVVFAICDRFDSDFDSGLLLNARGCGNDCPTTSIHINYVTTTTILAAGEQPNTQTIKALHTTSGTFIVGVSASTTSESSTSSTESSTSSTETSTSSTETSATATETESSTSSTETESSTSSTETESSTSSTATESSTSSTETESSTTSSESSSSTESSTSSDSSTSFEPSTSSAEPSTTDASSTEASTTESSLDPTVTPPSSSSSSEEPEPSTSSSTTSEDLDPTTTSSSELPTETSSEAQTETESQVEPSTTEIQSESATETVSMAPSSEPTTEYSTSASAEPTESPTASPEPTEPPASSTESPTYSTESSSLETSSSEQPTVSSEPPTSISSSSISISSEISTSVSASEPSTSGSQTESPTEPPTTSFDFPTSSIVTSEESEPTSQEPSLTPIPSEVVSTSSESPEAPTSSEAPIPSEAPTSSEVPAPSSSSPMSEPGLPSRTTRPPFSNSTTTTGGQSSVASTTTPASTASATPSNIPSIEGYEFVGCLTPGISAGLLYFDEVLTADNMTTAYCISLAAGRGYIGLFNTSCYASDTLVATEFIPNGQCNLPCPGDPGLFCGGLMDGFSASGLNGRAQKRGVISSLDRRAVPYGILLTIYALPDLVPAPPVSTPTTGGFVETSTTTTTTTSTTDPSSSSVDLTSSSTFLTLTGPASAVDSSTLGTDSSTASTSPSSTSSVSPSSSSQATEVADPVASSTGAGVLPPVVEIATTVITVAYTTLCPTNPASLILTETCITLPYQPCKRCANHGVPSVEMATITADCMACGHNGESRVTLTVPQQAVASASQAAPANNGLPGVTGAPGQTANANVGTAQSPGQAGQPGSLQTGTTVSLGAVPAATETQQTVPTGQASGTTSPPVVTAGGSRNSICWGMLAAVVGFMGMM